jgi:hypothetical protein
LDRRPTLSVRVVPARHARLPDLGHRWSDRAKATKAGQNVGTRHARRGDQMTNATKDYLTALAATIAI